MPSFSPSPADPHDPSSPPAARNGVAASVAMDGPPDDASGTAPAATSVTASVAAAVTPASTASSTTTSAAAAAGPAAENSSTAPAPAAVAGRAGALAAPVDMAALALAIKGWGRELGFADLRITDCDLSHLEPAFQEWLAAGYHGQMDYMAAHGTKRSRPAELVPGTLRVISARMDYLPRNTGSDWRAREFSRLADPAAAVVSVYGRGRDYHKVLRGGLQRLAERISAEIGPFGYRAFTDSAPVMEVGLGTKAGLGWRGKHTLLLNRQAGSMFFLGELYTDLPLPIDGPVSAHCGQCSACIDVCPTQAILGPGRLDARRCVSYLTIELKDSIPLELRALIRNRVLGCDDCQLICPWNKFAQPAVMADFDVRNGLDRPTLIELFAWSEDDFNRRLEGSAIRRIGHERWLRNIAVGLGNAARGGLLRDPAILAALQARADFPSALVREHVAWALAQHA